MRRADGTSQNRSLAQRQSAGPEACSGKQPVQPSRRAAVQGRLEVPLEAESVVPAGARVFERYDGDRERTQGMACDHQHRNEEKRSRLEQKLLPLTAARS